MSEAERPPQKGLTRRDTGYPSDLYPGWFYTRAEVKRIVRRSAHRGEVLNDAHVGHRPVRLAEMASRKRRSG